MNLIKAQKLESLGSLVGGIAHDFNNLLTSILGNIELAEIEAEKAEGMFKRLAAAKKGCLDARSLIQKLITFSKANPRIKKTGNLMPILEDSVSIKDRGVGIPNENLHRVFDPYFTTKQMGKQRGLGLGLSVTYAIIKSHGGYIHIESDKGEGTTIRIYLPVSLDHSHASHGNPEELSLTREKCF
ncbi:MAG: ATP-binding protein [Thermodesulfobacteriota bacterium]|nr:ATP-binding protein [Thermodesulfobacteriota bacterium]